MKYFILPQNITTCIINNTTCHQFKNKIKLEWQKFVNEKQFNWEESKTFANQLKLNGAGWKLPKLNELEGLVNKNYNHYEYLYPRISLNFVCFGNYMRFYFWSASPVIENNNNVWSVYFFDGSSRHSHKYFDLYVRCVR